MPLNIPGLIVPFQLLFYPRLALPAVVVKDIRQLDWAALKAAGYRGAVFDKDNCLTIPHNDTLVPQLQDAWSDCLHTFGPGNVLIVSNSAGTHLDPGGIQAESVSYHLRVPVLTHRSLKPAYTCITSIRTYFASLASPIRDGELIVVGDRIFTDIIMANRMALKSSKAPLSVAEAKTTTSNSRQEALIPTNEKEPDVASRGPLAIWTTGVWQKESMAMRWCEQKLVDRVRVWTNSDPSVYYGRRFVKREVVEEMPVAKRPWYWPPPMGNEKA
ncbi:mitochondrial PGP phosphatase-domain-containing protein [Pterulicium gracile]|uniref:Mitochondrial PGP phosphatase-domain-containing protein n=1 Tax=Pterulicium gracile TaxID=1884261 RepID=A0A5C3R1V2_9AGAR|nr:mitochondrial PGP phosphatase-domain-containing protein [Pterula gracilis]